MQTDTTNTTTNATETTTETTTEQQPTIADYLKARGEELRQIAERAVETKRAKAESDRTSRMETLTGAIEKGITPGLRRALALSPVQWFISDTPHDESNDWFHGYPIAYFTLNGATWAITHQIGNMHIQGPDDYDARLSSEWAEGEGYTYNRSILDAIREYPAWLERQEQRRDAENAAAMDTFLAESEAPTLATTTEALAAVEGPCHYTEPAGSNPRVALLHRGAYVTVWYPSDGEYQAATWGTVESWTKRWLLLTLDTGKQQMIHWRHVATIEPREPRERPTEEPSKATTEAPRYDAEMMSEEIPF